MRTPCHCPRPFPTRFLPRIEMGLCFSSRPVDPYSEHVCPRTSKCRDSYLRTSDGAFGCCRGSWCARLIAAIPSPPPVRPCSWLCQPRRLDRRDRKSTRLNSSHVETSYAVFCLKKKKNNN